MTVLYYTEFCPDCVALFSVPARFVVLFIVLTVLHSILDRFISYGAVH